MTQVLSDLFCSCNVNSCMTPVHGFIYNIGEHHVHHDLLVNMSYACRAMASLLLRDKPAWRAFTSCSRAGAAFWQFQGACSDYPCQERSLLRIHGTPQGPQHDQKARPLPLPSRLGCLSHRSDPPGQQLLRHPVCIRQGAQHLHNVHKEL